MYQGFYDLTSSMVTQNRNLNVISNNMTNVLTPGYKADTFVASTFREELIYRYDHSCLNFFCLHFLPEIPNHRVAASG